MFWKYRGAKETVISLILYTFLSSFSTRTLLLNNGTLGFFHDWFIGPFPEMISQYGYCGFYLYHINFGSKIYPSDWLFRVLLIPFSFLGGEVISKGMLIFFFVLSGFSMFCFTRKILKLDYYGSLIAGLIYIFSPIVFTRAIAGHIYYLVGYSLTPLLLTAFHRAQATKEKRLPYSIISGIFFGLIGIQIHFFIMFFLIALLLILIDYKDLKNSLFVLALTLIIGFLLHFSWLLPLALTPPTAASLNTQTFLSYHEIVSAPTLLESIRIMGYKIHPYSYTNLIAQGIIPSWILIANFLMPIIATFALIRRKDKYTIGFGLILLIGIFLSKATNPPFGELFVLLFKYTPLIIFREIWHIAFLVFFSYTILTSILLHEITKTGKLKIRQIKAHVLTIILVGIIIVSNGYPLLLGNFAGYMQTYSLSNDYLNLYKTLQKDNGQYRILWLPSISPMKYNGKNLFGVDPLILYSPKPSFTQHIMPQSPASRLTMFLTSTINENKTRHFGNLISPFATKYIIQRNDFTSKYPLYTSLGLYPDLCKKWEPDVTNNSLAHQQDLYLKDETQNFKLYLNTKLSDFMYAPTTAIYGTNDLSVLIHLAKLINLTDVAYLTDTTQFETNNPIYLIKNDGFDLISIMTGLKIDPGSYATETDAEKGWINSKNWFWYNYLFASTMNNGAFTKNKSQLNIPIETRGSFEIWAKILKWQKGGKIRFTLDGRNETNVIALSSAFSIEWVKLYQGNLNQSHILTISNVDGENYIDQILILSKEQRDQMLTSKLENATIIYFIDPLSFETNIVKNPSFEEATDYYPLYWYRSEEGFTAILDNQVKYLGNVSLKVTTQVVSPWRWSWIRSSAIPIAPGEYQIVTHMRQENAKASHIAIEGLNKTTNTWVQLIQVPAGQDGSYDWKIYKTTLELNSEITMLRVALNAGWILDATKGNATTWFDDILIIPKQNPDGIFLNTNASVTKKLQIIKEGNYRIFAEILGSAEITVANQTFNVVSNRYEITDVGSIFLTKGSQELKIKALENIRFGDVWIYTSNQNRTLKEVFLQNTGKAEIVKYKQENPALWKATIKASSLFLLAFAAPHDCGWRAYVSDKKYQPIPLYGFINGFWINETGVLEITIEYEPQKWFYIGTAISISTLITCTAYLAYSYTKTKHPIKKLKQKLKPREGRGSTHYQPKNPIFPSPSNASPQHPKP